MPIPNETTARRPLLNERKVADFLNCSVKVLQKWRAEDRGPLWFRIGPSMVRYDPDDVDRYVREGERQPDQRRR